MATGDELYPAPVERLVYTNSGSTDISAGAVVLMGDRIAVAVVDIAAGESGAIDVLGVKLLDKTTGEAWATGQQLYWVAGTAKVSTTAGSNKRAGYAAAAATSGATTGYVNLNA